MKRILFSFIFLGVAVYAQAQPAAGNFFVGGSFSISSSSEKSKFDGTTNTDNVSTEISVLPKAGYFLSDKIAVGAGIGVVTTIDKAPDSNPDKQVSNSFLFRPFGRYYLISGTGGIFAEATMGMQIGKEKTYYETTTEESNLVGFTAGIAPGVYYYITPQLGLEATFGFFGFIYQSTKYEDDSKDIRTGGGIDISPSSFTFGLTYTF
jgi:outer membrane protein